METKFNSQICTTREQSGKLIALGLKKETADMVYEKSVTYPYEYELRILEDGDYLCSGIISDSIPAWSLHRLIEMMPNCIPNQGWLSLGHQGLHYSKGYGVADDGLYESIIRMYEWLIKEGYFNKEYLED